MSYNSKYTGAKVEELLDQIANGEVDNVYVTDFTFYDLFDVFYSEGEASKAADIASLLAAAQANKIIIVPISSEAKSGCVANLNVYDEAIQLWFYYFSTRIELYLSSTSTEIKAEDVWMEDVQSALISGETIKTINGEEILGGGDIELATKEELNAKQDAISDLDAIRSGAEKGATALQEESYKGTIVAEDANIPIDEPWDMSFAVLPNGNISVTVNGVSNTFMPATPSGDPMHDIYVNVGAEYNDTGEDIVRTSIYGDDIVWKNAHWWLNDLGDITTDEMRRIYLHSNITQAAKSVSNLMQGIGTRTNIATWTGTWNTKIMDAQIFGYCTALKTARLRDVEHYLNTNASWMFTSCSNVEKIFPTLNATSTTSFNGSFDSCASLKEIRLKALGVNCSFAKAQNLSNLSILYMINNSNTSKTLTITLHANAYDRAMADDEIVAALSSHTNITLAKA